MFLGIALHAREDVLAGGALGLADKKIAVLKTGKRTKLNHSYSGS